MKRHREYFGHSRRDIPEGCTDKLTLYRMWEVLTFPIRGRKLKQKLRSYKFKRIIWLRSTEEVEDFLAQQEQDADDKSNSTSTVPSAKEKLSVAPGR